MDSVRKPSWLKIKLPGGEGYAKVSSIVKDHKLHTICSSGMCPNIGECWGNGTATFMILGDTCTRSCGFCATATGKPLPPDSQEPSNVARSVELMELKHCVVTSVTRDDLPDQGVAHWRDTVIAIKKRNPNTRVEVLIPDFGGKLNLLDIFLLSKPHVVGHNLETVERLTPLVRSKANYQTSLDVIAHITKAGHTAKSGLMLGLGETKEEVLKTLNDLIAAGCKYVTIGQYLQPRSENLKVERYVEPEEFEMYKMYALEKGFLFAESGPLVRSSYHAEQAHLGESYQS